MKKFVAMLAFGLAIAGTTFAQDAPQNDKRNKIDNQGKARWERNQEGRIQGREHQRREKLSPEEHANRRTDMLSQKLDLNNNQKKKLQALNLKHAQQMESMRGQYSNNDNNRNENKKEEMKRLRADWEKEFKGIVSKKQFQKFEEQRKQMQANHGNRFGREGEKENRFRRSNNG
ncbi:DUF4890 domain-containing protein [Adhaeribacter aquaticus]|uniref:DUF4890 domain-containing protein n=1 Tax=Adhaeribacter aquaticus TaxID=299567 RepID=UPI00047A0EA8|nr:DUF4890 domain-containing protein [Adhaeribacter aquaticus]